MPSGSPGKPKSPEQKEKMRLAAIARYADKAKRDEQSARMKKVFANNPNARKMHTKESRQKQGATLTDLWKTDEYRDVVLASRSHPHVLAALRAGTQNQWTNPEFRASVVQHLRERICGHITSENYQHLNDAAWLSKQNAMLTIMEIAELLGCSPGTVSTRFMKFGIVPKSHPRSYTGGEQLVLDFVSKMGITNVSHRDVTVISPYEIDIYLPDQKIGIEYHGMYWHSYDRTETPIERQRHLRKLEAANAAGIRLLQFWDYEWTDPSYVDISKSIVQSALGLSTRLGARVCEINIPSHAEVSDFLALNHIQQSRPFTYAAGLYHANELMMVMTVGRSRYVSGAWELLRLATKKNVVIAGGAQRLWSTLRAKLPSGVVVHSYADRRLFTGNIYAQLGFTFSHHTPPGYHYCLGGKLYSRLQFQKHKLAKMLPVFDATLTEGENMFAAGYRRVWDAGQSVWSYTTPNV